MQENNANIIIYCRDKMPKTVESVMNHIKAYLKETPGPPGGKYVLAGGAVGVQAAIRETIADAQLLNLILALGGVLLCVAWEFKSFSAGLILTIPLAISNYFTFALMGAYHIGLTTNTFPVSSIGIGLGVDYGIYFVGRLVEEREKGKTITQAIYQALINQRKIHHPDCHDHNPRACHMGVFTPEVSGGNGGAAGNFIASQYVRRAAAGPRHDLRHQAEIPGED